MALIPPFADGNGRISRAIAIWLFYSRGFDTYHLYALDEYFEQDRQQYYLKIQQARDLDDDLSYWLDSPEIEKAFSISRARVNQIIKPLIDAGLVIREGQTRATTYRLP